MTAGYKRWALWLALLSGIALVPFLFLFMLFAFSGVSETTDAQDTLSWLLFSLITLMMFIYTVAGIYLTARELARSGFALKIDRTGLHVWSSTKDPIPWSDIKRIQVDDMFLDSGRSIEISLKKKIVDYASPYSFINLHRRLTLGTLRSGLTIGLTGVACDNKTLRRHISSYTDKLER